MLSGSMGSRWLPSHKVEGRVPSLWVRHADMDDNRTMSRHLSQSKKQKQMFARQKSSLFYQPLYFLLQVLLLKVYRYAHPRRGATGRARPPRNMKAPSSRVSLY